MPALLSVERLCMRFGDYQALDHIDLRVEQGEFIALLGPSGCGKTTLLRAIAGFLKPATGCIAIDGQDVGRLAPHRRPLNTVFQNYALFPHMTVLENVAYGPRRQGASRAEAGERARQALDMVGLAGYGERMPRDMSGGQQQRVALARALVNRPKLLLLDEPLSALDLKLRKRMQLELKHLQARLGIAFVFVTHDQEEAMTMADRVVVMNAGRIEQAGSGTDIYRRPASRFVAEFIGDANLLPFQSADGGALLALPGRSLHVALNQPVPPRGTAVLRPEDLAILDGDAGPHQVMEGTITDVIGVGSHTLVHVDANGQPLMARCTGPAAASLRPGEAARLGFLAGQLHLIGESP